MMSPPPCDDDNMILMTSESGRLVVLRCRSTGWGVLVSIMSWCFSSSESKSEVAEGTKVAEKDRRYALQRGSYPTKANM